MASKRAFVVGGAGVYAVAVATTYTYFKKRPAPSPCSCCGGDVPFAARSAAQYEKIASSYDAKISADEAVMGVGLLRKVRVESAELRSEGLIDLHLQIYPHNQPFRHCHQIHTPTSVLLASLFTAPDRVASQGKSFGGCRGYGSEPGLLQVC